MTVINLLPWREQARQENKIRFLIILGISVAITLILALLYHVSFSSIIAHQERKNNYLQMELNNEKSTLDKLILKKKEQAKIIEDINFIFSLRESGYKAARLLEELAKITPESIVLTQIKRVKNNITVAGKAESNLKITVFMDEIGKSRFFKKPTLADVKELDRNVTNEKDFELNFEPR